VIEIEEEETIRIYRMYSRGGEQELVLEKKREKQ
jgi:hypothetical protein